MQIPLPGKPWDQMEPEDRRKVFRELMEAEGFRHLMALVRAERAALQYNLIAGEIGKTAEEMTLQTAYMRGLFKGLTIFDVVLDRELEEQKAEDKDGETE